MIFHACNAEGTKLGEFNELEFQAKVFSGELSKADFYWHEGMTDWRPIPEYRLLAKTQRISVLPMSRTIKINVEPVKAPESKPQSPVFGLLGRIRNKINRQPRHGG